MSRLNELIAELCPDGVEFVPLWSVTIWDKTFNSVDRKKQPKIINYPYILAAELFALEQEEGDVFLLSTGEKIGWTTEELAGDNLCEGEVVTIPWGKSRPVAEVIKYYKGKFVTADNRIATSADTDKLLNKYLYHWLLSKGNLIDTFYRGSGIKHPSMKDVLDLQIQLPPLPVQCEIVRILDNFTELTAELTARRKQYEYYRDKLLTFEADVQWMTLDEVVNFRNGKGHEKAIINDGQYIVVNSKFISTNGEIQKYSDQQISPLYVNDILMVMSDLPNGRALAKCFLVQENDRYTLNQRICALTVKNERIILTKFLLYFLNRNPQLLRYDNGVDQTNLKKNDILSVKVPIIPVSEQEKIIVILDRFDALCNDLTSGLPAEIEARRKQYEYYRDKLLTFKDVNA